MHTIKRRILNWFNFEDEQVVFLNKPFDKVKKGIVEKRIAIQFQSESIFIERFFEYNKNYKSKPVLLNITKPHYSIYDIIFFPSIIFKITEQFFLTKKIARLNNKFFDSLVFKPKYGFINFIKYLPKSVILFFKLKNKKDWTT